MRTITLTVFPQFLGGFFQDNGIEVVVCFYKDGLEDVDIQSASYKGEALHLSGIYEDEVEGLCRDKLYTITKTKKEGSLWKLSIVRNYYEKSQLSSP